MSIIKLEFNEDDVIAQKYLGEALVNMARHRETGKGVSYEQQVCRIERTPTLDVEGLEKASRDGLNEAIENNTTSGRVQMPWDERIHSGNKTQNQDGSWKMRKKPKNTSPEQWDKFVADVEAELTTLMSIPVEEPNQYPIYWRHDGDDSVGIVRNDEEYNQIFNTPGCIVDEISEELFNELRVNTPEQDFEDTPKPPSVVTPPPVNHDSIVSADPAIGVVTIPKPPVINQDDQPAPPPPPVTDVAPVGNTPDVVEDAKPMTFVQLVQRMSAKCDGDVTKSAKIKDAISNKYAIEFAALVKRPELIPQIGAFLDTIEV